MAELALNSENPEPANKTLQRLLESEEQRLATIAQISARAALACAAPHLGAGSIAILRKVLAEADAVDLPLIRMKLLREMASRLQEQAPDEVAVLTKSADRIVAQEGYATALLPIEACVTHLIEGLGRPG
ncbi:hypothetical protein ACSQ76_16510 [Roseovarius sp. B08]|uniref:hypothetical protein n=1 Tax=Roseovarius sp. B08 TaxID=3449223 RepID=UPI003EDC928F